jgi:hypothetical protein
MTGEDKKPGSGDDKKPMTGEDKKPGSGDDKKPMTGEDKKPGGTGNQEKELTDAQRKEAEDLQKKAEELAKAMKDTDKGGQGPGLRPGDDQKPDSQDPEHQKKATDLALESLRKKMQDGEIDKDFLKKAGLEDAAALQKFFKDYDRIKRESPERLAGQGQQRARGPAKANTSLSNQKDLIIDPNSVPPPELRDALDIYTKKQAEGQRPK